MTTIFWGTAAGCVTTDGVPAHLQIESWLLGAIDRGDLAVGAKFPNERSLAASLGVSRMTLRQALAVLENKGFVTRVRGADGGTFVSQPQVEVDLTDLVGLSAQVIRAGRIAGATVVDARTVGAESSVANELKVKKDSLVHRVIRVRLADGEPIGIERSYFPSARFPDMLDKPLDGSLYAVLGSYGAAPVDAVEYLNAALATKEDAELLMMDPGAAVMLVQRLATDAHQQPVEFSRDVFRSDRMRLTVRSALKPGAAAGTQQTDNVERQA